MAAIFLDRSNLFALYSIFAEDHHQPDKKNLCINKPQAQPFLWWSILSMSRQCYNQPKALRGKDTEQSHPHLRIYTINIYWEPVSVQEEISIYTFIAPLSDIPMFYIKYLTMHKVHMHAGAIRQLLYGCEYVREIIHSLKLVDYPPIHTDKPCINFNVKHLI